MKTDKQKKKSNPKQLNQLNPYVKFSGLAFQMLAVIGIGTWFGYWLDDRLENGIPIFTLVFSMLALAAVITWLFKISIPLPIIIAIGIIGGIFVFMDYGRI